MHGWTAGTAGESTAETQKGSLFLQETQVVITWKFCMWGVLVSHELEDPEGSVVSVQMLARLQASFSVPELSACVFFLS